MNQSVTPLKEVIKNRRAVKKGYTNEEVTEDLVRELLADASWAPTHGMREPWRFVFVHQDRLPTFAREVGQTYPDELKENRVAYLNEPHAIVVALMENPEQQKQKDENFGAIESLIQNFWLLAWHRELGLLWKTNQHIYHEEEEKIVGEKEDERIVDFIHLGYFEVESIIKERNYVSNFFSTY